MCLAKARVGLQSWLCGKVVNLFEPEAVELHISRGYESASSKLLMRWTVVAFDLIGDLRTHPCLGFGAHFYAHRLSNDSTEAWPYCGTC